MGDYTPVGKFDSFTRTAGATITGGQLVTASGDNAASPSTTGDAPIGVALHDAPSGGRVTIATLPGTLHEVTIQGTVTIAAGVPIVAGTAGSVNTAALATAAAAGTLIGICVRGGTGGSGAGNAQFMGT